ncbi:hypothetical protein [Paenibacillus sp. HB172176]|uniref:hypothetical protein n=1 Tax=Paenibacillus sp. HB172176 TaxID=2493690 RepID=UPI00143A2B2D|nr:hypothetical protein [Paenibacillus sp. HB172176]
MKTDTRKPWNWLLFPFSSIKSGAEGIYAASVGHGVFEIDGDSNWSKLDRGLPASASIYRLQLQHDLLHACTSEGLFEWADNHWEDDGLPLACYQYRKIGGTCFAATEDGMWHRYGARWERLAYQGKQVYDFLNLPQFVIVGHETGIALYDKFMDEWSEFGLSRRVTSLSVYRGHLIGVSELGELFIGDKRGGFDRVAFGGKHIFTVASKGGEVYACTDQGLYKLVWAANRFMLLSVQLGFAVTDVDIQGDQLHVATLFHGIQSVQL